MLRVLIAAAGFALAVVCAAATPAHAETAALAEKCLDLQDRCLHHEAVVCVAWQNECMHHPQSTRRGSHNKKGSRHKKV